MKTPARYKILEQFRIKIGGGRTAIVSRLRGRKWHCNCVECNDGFCDVNCKHVAQTLYNGVKIDDPMLVAVAEVHRKEQIKKLRHETDKVSRSSSTKQRRIQGRPLGGVFETRPHCGGQVEGDTRQPA